MKAIGCTYGCAASRDITFMDDHHELEQVSLSVYPPVGEKPDQIAATNAIYDQDLNHNVSRERKIETKDA